MISMLNFQALAGNTVSQSRRGLSGLESSAGALGRRWHSKKPCGCLVRFLYWRWEDIYGQEKGAEQGLFPVQEEEAGVTGTRGLRLGQTGSHV